MSKVALLLSGNFEKEYQRGFGLNQTTYLNTYRNDWSWDYASGLKQENIEAILYVTSEKYQGMFETNDGFKVRFIQKKYLSTRISQVRFPPKRFKIGTYWHEFIDFVSFKDSLLSALEEDKIELLYIQEYWTNRFDFLINNIKIAIIGADHGGNNSLSIKSLKNKSLPKAYKITCQSQEEVELVKQHGGDAILITNSVDTNFYYPSSTKDQPKSKERKTILIVARLFDRQKKISDLIRALQYLDDNWTLEIAGTGPDLKFLQTLATNLGVNQRVSFLGFIKDKNQLREKYQQCSVFVSSSAWEAVSLVVLEAMSCGAAVVTTDIKTFKNLVLHKKNGVKVPVANPSAMAQGIIECYENREEYGYEARQIIIDSYSKKQLFSQLAKIIKLCPNLEKNEYLYCDS